MAQMVTLDLQTPPPAAVLRSWLAELERTGFQRVRTGAVSELRTSPYDALGFAVVQRLVLLHLDLSGPRPTRPGRAARPSARPARPADVGALAELDRRAFPPGWGLDETAVLDAADATPKSRVRMIDGPDGRPIAYAISGRSARSAFLQRLAVDPEHRGRGLGAILVEDSIRWSARWRSRTISVNTQDDNVTARRLYERAGFVPRSHGLVVLERALGDVR